MATADDLIDVPFVPGVTDAGGPLPPAVDMDPGGQFGMPPPLYPMPTVPGGLPPPIDAMTGSWRVPVPIPKNPNPESDISPPAGPSSAPGEVSIEAGTGDRRSILRDSFGRAVGTKGGDVVFTPGTPLPEAGAQTPTQALSSQLPFAQPHPAGFARPMPQPGMGAAMTPAAGAGAPQAGPPASPQEAQARVSGWNKFFDDPTNLQALFMFGAQLVQPRYGQSQLGRLGEAGVNALNFVNQSREMQMKQAALEQEQRMKLTKFNQEQDEIARGAKASSNAAVILRNLVRTKEHTPDEEDFLREAKKLGMDDRESFEALEKARTDIRAGEKDALNLAKLQEQYNKDEIARLRANTYATSQAANLELRRDNANRLWKETTAKIKRWELDRQPIGQTEIVSAGAEHALGMPLNQVVPGYGALAARNREQVREEAVRQIMQEHPGMSLQDAGMELARRQVDYVAGRRSVTTLNNMLGTTRAAVSQLDYNIKRATQEMDKLKSTDLSPILNAIIRGEEKWTGNPAYVSLFFFMQASAIESARIMSGGTASIAQLHEGARMEAQKWANINMTPKMWKEGIAPAMLDESRARVQQYEEATRMQGGREGMQPQFTTAPPPTASAQKGAATATVPGPATSKGDIPHLSATNPKTGEKIESDDGGKTWHPTQSR